MVIDSHAHLNDKRIGPELGRFLAAARAAGVSRIMNVGYDLASSELAVRQAENNRGVFAAVGLHPHDARHFSGLLCEKLLGLAGNGLVKAWGEIGLDYHYDNSPRGQQQAAFVEQLRLAKRLNLPVIIHDRDAHRDVLQILQSEAPLPAGGVMHCYSASQEMVRDFLDLGLYISFAGPVTFRNARKLADAASVIPEDRLLAETDCPYLTPEPYRGKLNHPALVTEVVRKLADIRATDYDTMARITAINACKLFGLPMEGDDATEAD